MTGPKRARRLFGPRYLKEFRRQLGTLSSARTAPGSLTPSRVGTWVLAAEEAAATGEQEATRTIGEHRPEVVLLAVRMTGVDGDLLERVLEAHQRGSRPPRSIGERQEIQRAYAAEIAAVDVEWRRRHQRGS